MTEPARRGVPPAMRAILALAVGIALSGHAAASPSDVGGPGVSKDSKWKMTLEYKDDGGRSWTLPKVAYSTPLSETFEGEVALSRLRFDHSGGGSTAGVGDVEFKGKWALVQGDGGARPGVALEPKLIMPAGSREAGLGVEVPQFELPVLVAWQGQTFGLYTKAGIRQGFEGERELRRYMGGALVTWQPTPGLRWGLDAYAEGPRHETSQYKLHTNLGLNWYVSRAIEVQALVGKSLRHPDDRQAYKAKFVIEYKFDGRG